MEMNVVRALLVINAAFDSGTMQAERDAQLAGPRKDYRVLQEELEAEVIDLATLDRSLAARWIRRTAGAAVAQVLLAWKVSHRYDVIFADRESTGLGLAALPLRGRRRPRLVMIGHMLSSSRKQRLIRMLHLERCIDCVIVHSSTQQTIAIRDLGFSPRKVALVPYQVDQSFWKPMGRAPKNQICSVGLEYRDYDTLVEAAANLDVDIVIAAASHWSKHRAAVEDQPRVHVSAYNYAALRDLYAESLFVVVPLRDVNNQAGITVILEAMAMGKAVVVSHTRGQIDVVRDRRRVRRTAPDQSTQPDWSMQLGVSPSAAQGATGIYVTPGNAAELRRAIEYLLEHPDIADDMGARGRRVIEDAMGLDHFVKRVTALVGVELTSRHDDMPASARSRL